MSLPSLAGLSPRSEVCSAFSIGFTIARSHGWIRSRRGSGALTVATWFRGTCEPYASTRRVSSSAGLAFPVRTPEKSRRRASMALSIF
jgi:hypothetical protein